MNFIAKMIDRIFAVCGAIVFMQMPQFMQNYTENLAGHLAEVRWQLEQLRTMVHKSGRSLNELVAKFLVSPDSDIVFQGELIQGMVDREASFSSALTSISQASPYSKPLVFFKTIDWDIVNETSRHFSFGLPLSMESLTWGLLGLFAGYLLFRTLKRFFLLFIPRAPKPIQPN